MTRYITTLKGLNLLACVIFNPFRVEFLLYIAFRGLHPRLFRLSHFMALHVMHQQ